MDKINEILNITHLTVKHGNIERFIDLIQDMHAIEDKELMRTCYNNSGTDLISLVCKYNRQKHLNYLLHESHILHYLTSENKNTEMKSKEDSFYFAMCSNNLDTIEILYDYWSGDLHWLCHKKEYNKIDVQCLKELNNILKRAFHRYTKYLQSGRKINPQSIFHIESLINFNHFQRELYGKLNKLKTSLITWEDEPEDIIRIQETYAIKTMILLIFDIHKEHSRKGRSLFKKSILKTNVFKKDHSSLVYITQAFAMYITFFRKLDYNFCLLILDNLHLLKLRLSMPKNSYQEMENKLYHFIYHINNKWRLYLPKRKRSVTNNFLGLFKGRNLCWCSYTFDANEKNAYNIVYLERRDFERAMISFKKELQNRNIEDNIRKSHFKLPNEDNNSLMLLPHLRDDYSLRRISQHIAQLHSINVKYEKKYAFLFIQRTLQVVGEFLKSTDESLHLQHTTEALVKAEISIEAVNDLKTLRNLLCHAKNGELLKRIEVEENHNDIFDLVLQELLYVKKKIDEVIKVHKSIVERDLTRSALLIIYNRKCEMPKRVSLIYSPIVLTLIQIPHDFIRQKVLEDHYKTSWVPYGFSESLLEEVCVLENYTNKLDSKCTGAVINIHKKLVLKLPFYRKRIENSLKVITTHLTKWRQIVRILKNRISSISLLDYPNEEDANRIKSYINKISLESDSIIQPDEVNKLFANVEHHWKFIENILQFIVKTTRIFDDTIEELKWNLFTYRLQKLSKHSYRNNDVMEKDVIAYLDMMEEMLNRKKENNKILRNCNPNISHFENIPDFTGIKNFTKKITLANFLTSQEKNGLINTLNDINCKNHVKKCSAIKLMINKIKTDTAIPKNEYQTFNVLTGLESNSKKILMNLVMGYKRDPLLPQCFSKRMCLLTEIIQQQSASQMILQYKSDKTFRVLLEILLFDVFIILECNKNSPFVKKSSKLLTEINLRNILTHGSPLLEIVGNILDANDLPTELITKALSLLEDKNTIDAMCALNDLGFDFTQINNIPLDAEHKLLLNEFKKSPRWKDYLKLLPEYKHNMYINQKKVSVIDENSVELLKAVKKKNAALVQKSIDEGANVNFVDSRNKAVVHYAAMNGCVSVLKVLLENGANVNIRNKENNLTALHYSAMNNFIDSVILLLNNGADCLALDDKGRTPVYLAGQRKHVDVCHVMVKAMKQLNIKT